VARRGAAAPSLYADSVTGADPRYVAARRVLLDALFALRSHADGLIIAGAQAVYLNTGDGDLAVAPFTTDADIAVDPQRLSADPLIEAAMYEAGFELALFDGHVEPGIWISELEVQGEPLAIPVDLIVPEAAATGGGRRGARLGVHGQRAARRAIGLEACLVDHAQMTIAALDSEDPRSTTANVAGPAALLVAKAYKIHDRVASGKPGRLEDKDAGDVLRLMQSTTPDAVAGTLSALAAHPVCGEVTINAIAFLDALFGRRGAAGIEMATRAMRLAVPADRVQAICVAYTGALVAAAR
jgi:hypothetical protein